MLEERDGSGNWEHLNKRLRAEVSSTGDHSTPRSSIDRSVHAFSILSAAILVSTVTLVLVVCLP